MPIAIQAADVGTTRWLQLWFRDPNRPGGTGSGLTDAAEVTICP